MKRVSWGAVLATQLPAMLVVYLTAHIIANGGPSWVGFLFYAALAELPVIAAPAVIGAYLGSRRVGPRISRRHIVASALGATVGAFVPCVLLFVAFAAGGLFAWFLLIVAAITAATTSLNVGVRITRAAARPAWGELPLN